MVRGSGADQDADAGRFRNRMVAQLPAANDPVQPFVIKTQHNSRRVIITETKIESQRHRHESWADGGRKWPQEAERLVTGHASLVRYEQSSSSSNS